YLICSNENTIKVYNLTTGDCVKTLSVAPEYGGHTKEITSLAIDANDPSLVYSSSLDGTIKIWNFEKAVLLETLDLKAPIYRMIMDPKHPKDIYVSTQISSSDLSSLDPNLFDDLENDEDDSQEDKSNHLLRIHRLNNEEGQFELTKILSSSYQISTFDIGVDGKHLVAVFEYSYQVINLGYSRKERRQVEWPRYVHPKRITSIAINSSRPCVAIGDELGKITLSYCLKKGRTKFTKSVWHWHAHAVNCMAFSNDGVYLLSGGEESVLVIWQVETGQRKYVPRLGSEITFVTISPNQTLYAVGMTDNTIKVLSAMNYELRQVIHGLKYVPKNISKNPLTTGLVVEPRNYHIVLPASPGNLQWYDAHNGRHIIEHEVTLKTFVSRTDKTEIVMPNVDFVTFSEDGDWMVTVDSRDDKKTTPEIYLKFWEFSHQTNSFVLNTIVEHPHKKSFITSVAFRPTSKKKNNDTNDENGNDLPPMVVTTGLDKDFKIWELKQNSVEPANTNNKNGDNKNKKNAKNKNAGIPKRSANKWVCTSIGSYREETPRKAVFSEDGTVLAIAFGPFITLWNPILNEFHGVLSHVPMTMNIENLMFMSQSLPYLVSTTKDYLYLWDLTTFSIKWQYRIHVKYMSADKNSSNFVVAATCDDNTCILVFDPQTPIPHSIRIIVGRIIGLTYLPKNIDNHIEKESSIVYMDKDCRLRVLGQRVLIDNNNNDCLNGNLLLSDTSDCRSYFSDIFGNSSSNQNMNDDSHIPTKLYQKNTFVAFDAPSHLIPPVNLLFDEFMEGLLVASEKKNDEEKEEMDDKDKEKSEMDDKEKEKSEMDDKETEKETIDVNVELSEKAKVVDAQPLSPSPLSKSRTLSPQITPNGTSEKSISNSKKRKLIENPTSNTVIDTPTSSPKNAKKLKKIET
ncbi:4030_t:CDS:10, partial [Ambispora leptoticha]